MKIFKCEPNKKGYVKEIKGDLESLHTEIGGYIQLCYLPDDIVAICDEEGRIKNLEPNIYLPNYGVICGNIIFAKNIITNKGPDLGSLSNEEIERLESYYNNGGSENE